MNTLYSHPHILQYLKTSLRRGLQLLYIFVTFSIIMPGIGVCRDTEADNLKTVVFIRYNLKDEPSSAIVNEFKKTMRKRGYTEGVNVEYIDIVTQSEKRDSAIEVLEATEKYKDSTDIFITSSWVSLYTRSRLSQSSVPQIFAPVLKSEALNMLTSVTKEPGTNLSGVYLMYPPEKILRLTRLILPHIKNYAYVYDPQIPADLIFKAAYNKLNASQRHGMSIHFINLSSDPKKVLGELKKYKVEAFGGIVGVFKNRKFLSQSGLPVITSLLLDLNEDTVADYVKDSNIIAGLYNSFGYCGEQAAEMTADIFQGKNTIEKTIPRPARQTAFANMAAADRLNIHIPFQALEGVDIVIK